MNLETILEQFTTWNPYDAVYTGPVMRIFGPIFLLTIAVDFAVHWKNQTDLYKPKDAVSSLLMGFGAGIVGPLAKMYSLVLFTIIFELTKSFRLELLGYESFGIGALAWFMAILWDDFNFYWHHRFSHTVRVLWAAHIVHHSSRDYHFATGFRNGWFTLFYKPIFWVWMPIVGFEPITIFTAMAINSVYQFFLHNHYVPRLGFLDYIFNTPIRHQVHHACNLEYLDRNHGGMFIFWDKLFGTFQENEPDKPPIYGVLKEPDSYNPLIIVSHEYRDIIRDVRKAKTWKGRFMYIFGEPGWSEDGSTMTAKQAQEAKAYGELLKTREDMLEGMPPEERKKYENTSKKVVA